MQRKSFPTLFNSHFPRDGKDAGTLLQRADAAMYRAKQRGRNAVELYSTEVNRGAAGVVALTL